MRALVKDLEIFFRFRRIAGIISFLGLFSPLFLVGQELEFASGSSYANSPLKITVERRSSKESFPGSAMEHENLQENYDRCDASDIGTDALWKFTSKSGEDVAVFIPPMGACKTKEILDKQGKGTGKYKVIRNKIAFVSMCTDITCDIGLNFEKVSFGEFCAWRVHQGNWEEFFGKKKFKVFLTLDDERILIWNLKNPTKRNGMPPYKNLKYKVIPNCYKIKDI